MAWKNFKHHRIVIWIGAASVFFAALVWQAYTLPGKKEGFQAGASYVLSGPEMKNNAFYARIDLSCNALMDCQSCATKAPVVLEPNGLVKSAKCIWCPSKSKCMVDLPEYVTDLTLNTINETMCDWKTAKDSDYECQGLAEKALKGVKDTSSLLPIPKDPPIPVSQQQQKAREPIHPLPPSDVNPYPPVITSPGNVRPVDAGSERPTFPAAAKPVGWDANNGPFEEYVKMLIDSELAAKGVPTNEGFQGSLDAVVSNVQGLLKKGRS